MTYVQVLTAWSRILPTPSVRALTPGRVWEVSAESVARYVLKRFSPPGRDEPLHRLIDAARIVSYLAQRGLPVAVHVLCDDGRVYAIDDDDGGIYTLTPIMPANRTRTGLLREPALYQNIGATFATMHAALAECPYGIESDPIDPDSFADTWRRLENSLPSSVFDELVTWIRPWQEAIHHAVAEPHRQRVHGDVHGANILTDDRKVTGIIDVDHLQLAPRSYDLGYYLAFWLEWALGQDETDQSLERGAALVTRHLLTGYHNVATLTSRETAALPAMSLAVALILLDYFLTKHHTVAETWVRTVHWIVAHPRAFLAQPRSPLADSNEAP